MLERQRTFNQIQDIPLKISRLRKVFLPKQFGRTSVTAAEDVSFCVGTGEIFEYDYYIYVYIIYCYNIHTYVYYILYTYYNVSFL